MTLDDMIRASDLQPAVERTEAVPVRMRVLFLADSSYASSFGLPSGAGGVVCDRYRYEDGIERVSLLVEGAPGIGYATGVPMCELRPVETSRGG